MTKTEDLQQMWLTRKEGFMDEGEELYWIQVKDQQSTMEVDAAEEKTKPELDNSERGKDKVFSKISPIAAFKKVKLCLNPQKNSISRTREGYFNVQIPRNEVDLALQITELQDVPVAIEKHPFLNTSRGTVFDFGTIDMSVESIKDDLQEYNVKKVVKKTYYDKTAGKKEFSGKLVLTFDKIDKPKYINLGWMTRLEVEDYEPDPMRCKTCFGFGAKCFSFEDGIKNECKIQRIPLCGWCLGNEHVKKGEKCEKQVQCKNCEQGDHPSWSKECPAYIREKEILGIKEVKKISYTRAKAVLDGRLKSGKTTAARVVAKDLEEKEIEWRKKYEESNRKKDEEIAELNEMWEKRLECSDRRWSKEVEQTKHDWSIKFQQMENKLESKIDKLTESCSQLTEMIKQQGMLVQQLLTGRQNPQMSQGFHQMAPMFPSPMIPQLMSAQSREYMQHMQKSLLNENFLSDAATEDEQEPLELDDDSMDVEKEERKRAQRSNRGEPPPSKVIKPSPEKPTGPGDPGGQ